MSMLWLDRVMWAQLALAALALALAGLALDSRELLGVSVWLKPLKFEISIFIFLFTLRWMIPLYPPGFCPAERVARYAAVAMAAEIALINLQAARGVTSHFNESTWFDALVFNVMGLFILLNTYAAGNLAWLYWTAPPSMLGPGLLWGIRWASCYFWPEASKPWRCWPIRRTLWAAPTAELECRLPIGVWRTAIFAPRTGWRCTGCRRCRWWAG